MKLQGLDLADVVVAEDELAAATNKQLTATMRAVTRPWAAKGAVDLDDLTAIKGEWTNRVHRYLMPQLNAILWRAVNAVARPVIEYHAAQTAAAPVEYPTLDDLGLPADLAESGVTIGRLPFAHAEQYLADASNRLVRVSDAVWEQARGVLLDGMQAGDGVRELANRVARVSPELAMPRAEVIARTEANGAANAGAIGQFRALGVEGTKTWVATGDGRTRPDHANADGQTVKVDQPFEVGGWPMDRPHDGPAEQVVNCRCTLSFEMDPDDVEVTMTVQPDRVIPFDEAVSDIPAPGERVRYETPGPGMGMFTEKDLRAIGFDDLSLRRATILRFNDVIAARFGRPFARVERLGPGSLNTTNTDGTYAWVRRTVDGDTVLGLNPKLLWSDRITHDEQYHFHPPGSGSILDILIHEHGHYMLMSPRGLPQWDIPSQRADATRRWQNAKNAALKAAVDAGAPKTITETADVVSRYAKTSGDELDAEMWAWYHMGKAPEEVPIYTREGRMLPKGKYTRKQESRPQWLIAWGETFLRELGLDPTPLCKDLEWC